MSSPTNTESPSLANPTTVAIISSDDEPVSSRESSVVWSDAPEPVDTSFRARDISPDTVTSPLQALALACVAERASENQQPSAQSQTNTFTKSDVLCGRGGLTNNADGNVYFRHLVRLKRESYLLATKREKAGVARQIVEAVRALDPPGRFLKKDSNGMWVEIGDRKAREKTSQALRENAPELRQELQTNDDHLHEATAGPHLIASTETMHPGFLHPRKFFKPDPRFDSVSHFLSSNRARVVSDDSVVGILPLLQNGGAAAGCKRKVDDRSSCSSKENMEEEQDIAKRGPRLKLLKSRLMV